MATNVWLSDDLIARIKSGLVGVNSAAFNSACSRFKSIPPIDSRGKLLQPQYIQRMCTVFESMIESYHAPGFTDNFVSFKIDIETKGPDTPNYVCNITDGYLEIKKVYKKKQRLSDLQKDECNDYAFEFAMAIFVQEVLKYTIDEVQSRNLAKKELQLANLAAHMRTVNKKFHDISKAFETANCKKGGHRKKQTKKRGS